MSTKDRGELREDAAVKEFLTTAEASGADADELAKLARLEKQLKQKKGGR
jgi:hypothetical protein